MPGPHRWQSRTPRTEALLNYLAPVGQGWRLPLDALLLGLLLFAAFSYGASEPWSQQIVALLAVIAAVYVLVACGLTQVACRPVGSWTYVPIVVFLGLVVLQAVPLPAALTGLVAGGNLETRAELLSDLPDEDGAVPVSLLPAATWRTLWMLLPVVTVFVLVLHAYRTEAGVRRGCELLAVAGAVIGLYALYQHAAMDPLDFGGAIKQHGHSGPFINHSHFGQFINLGVGGAAGVLLVRLSRLHKEIPSARRAWRKLRRERKHALTWVFAALVALGVLVVPLSLTRGGTIAMVLAGGVAGALLAWNGRSGSGSGGAPKTGRGSDQAAVFLALGILALTVMLVFGFDRVFDRFAQIGEDTAAAEGGRLQILTDLWPAFGAFPLVGTGLGTFESVYPRYDTGVRTVLTTHAENEYAQLMLETGVLGLACIAVFLLLVLGAAWRVVRGARRTLDFAAFGLLFGLLAVLLHSFTDFGQHLPAVALMTAVTCATLLNLAALHRARPADDDATVPRSAAQRPEIEATAATIGPRPLRLMGPAVLALLAIGAGVGVVRLDGPRLARAAFAQGENIRERIYGSDAQLIQPGDDQRMIRKYAEAAELDPAVPAYAYTRDYFTWGLLGFDEQGSPVDLNDDPEALAATGVLVDEINAERRAAPTYGPMHRLVGEVLFFGLGEADRGAELIARGQALTPHDPYAAYTAGYVAARRGDHETAMAQFRRATALSAGLRRDVVDVYINELDRADLAAAFAADDLPALQHLALLLSADDFADPALVEQTNADIYRALTERAYADEPLPSDLVAMARVRRERDETDEAIGLYRRAVALAPTRVGWRLELARLYAELGYPAEAVREARACLQLRPDYKAAQALLQDQIVLEGMIADPEPPS